VLKIKEISSYEEFKGMKGAWNELVSRSGVDNIYLTHVWIDSYINNCCNDNRLIILAVFEGDNLIGIAPLMIRKHNLIGIVIRSVCFIGTRESDRMDFILAASKEECVQHIMNYIMDINKDWDFLDFQEIPKSSGTVEVMEKWANDRKLKSVSDPWDRSFFIKLNGSTDLLLKKVSKKLRKKTKKLNRRVKDSLEFKRYMRDEVEEGLFSDIQSVTRHSWKAEKRKSVFLQERTEGFHKKLFLNFTKYGYLNISILRMDNKPIAYIYNFLYNNRLYNYSIDFDIRYSHVSPGTMLMLWSIENSDSKKIKEIDFGRGEEEWKMRLTQDFRMQGKIKIFNDSFYGKGLYLLHSGIRLIKGHKFIYGILRKVKQGLL